MSTKTVLYEYVTVITMVNMYMAFTMHKFALGGYLLQKTKERMLLIISKKKDICKCKGKSG